MKLKKNKNKKTTKLIFGLKIFGYFYDDNFEFNGKEFKKKKEQNRTQIYSFL